MSHATGKPAQGIHLLGLQEPGFQFTLLGTVQQHTEDAFLASRADQRCKKETYERPPAGVLEFNLQILHRAFRLQLLKEDGPFFPGLPEAEIDSSFSDDMVRRQFQELQQVFIYVEEYSLH